MSISQVNTQKNKLQDKENSYQTLETNHYKRENQDMASVNETEKTTKTE